MAEAAARTATGSDRVAAHLRAHRHRTLERRLLRLGADLVVVSPDDARHLSAVLGVDVLAVPIGVPTLDAPRSPSALPRPGTGLVFTGRLDWAPNIAAARSLVTEVLPRVRAVVPDATVRLVGAAPAAEVWALASGAVEVLPDRADLLAEYARNAVAVFPGGHGWGIRGSVLQAFVAGIPVVASRASLCGQTLGPHAVVADDPAAQAAAVVGLLRDTSRWHEAAAASAAYGAGWPTWAASTDLLVRSLRARQQAA
jgi:glycosyltransferase involved in cell wall biosynthesis